jgi:hypothetical protein
MSGQIFQMKSDKIMPRLCIEPAYRSIGDETVSDRVSIYLLVKKMSSFLFFCVMFVTCLFIFCSSVYFCLFASTLFFSYRLVSLLLSRFPLSLTPSSPLSYPSPTISSSSSPFLFYLDDFLC